MKASVFAATPREESKLNKKAKTNTYEQDEQIRAVRGFNWY